MPLRLKNYLRSLWKVLLDKQPPNQINQIMKKFFVIIFVFAALTSCKNDQKKEESVDTETKTEEVADLTTISGEFLFLEDAAVLKTHSEVYGVVIDDKMHELNNKCQPLKKEVYDMIPVVVKGNVLPNPNEEGWKEVIEIKEIVSVSAPAAETTTVIKVKEE